ncbi:MAG: hypothetical protein KKB31_01065 [Nanoarchaeota archaeon]|nr:hypothetical protein [Nanoarchaeota archaeon]
MEVPKRVREEDNKVVMSKLPRDEFANFKKLCDGEGKTINKKLRELINHEVNSHFGFPINGTKKKFFVPAENRIIEMVEVDDET